MLTHSIKTILESHKKCWPMYCNNILEIREDAFLYINAMKTIETHASLWNFTSTFPKQVYFVDNMKYFEYLCQVSYWIAEVSEPENSGD